MSLDDVRKRLPIVQLAKPTRSRRVLPLAPGEMPKPRLAVWEFTLACDHRCLHCGPRAGLARDDELSTEEALRLVDDLAEIGVGEVTLIGGEAYLRNDFLLVIRRIREHGMSCTLTTGGLNLTQKRCDAMVEAGIESVNVSIDGLEATHDKVRDKPGSWKAAFRALDNLRRAGAQVACNSQINGLNRFEHIELIEHLAAAGIHSWQLQTTIPHGNACEHDELLVQPWMYLEIYEELAKVIKRARELRIRIWPGNNLGYFGPLEHDLRSSQQSVGHYRGCTAGTASIGIESNGQIKACPTLGGPTNLGGSWREHGLHALWSRSPEITYNRRRTVDDLWGFCSDCYYASTCMAGCTATAEPLLGRPGNNPYCHHRALEMDRAGQRERLEPVFRAGQHAFGFGSYRLIREHKDPARREAEGPIEVVEPRVTRLVEEMGPGRVAAPTGSGST